MKLLKLISTFIAAIMCRLQGIEYGKQFACFGIPVIAKSKGSSIVLGSNCRLRSAFISNLLGLYQKCSIVAKKNAYIKIGNDVGMSGVSIYACKGINIGNKCLIGANTKIIDNDFHPIDPVVRRERPLDEVASKEINIGENVFIGCNSLILKGVTIGGNTVIGAGSVVSKSIPANCVAAGNPAVIVKQLEGAYK